MDTTRQLTFRLPEDLIARVEECTRRIRQSGLSVTRTDVVRLLLSHALDHAARNINAVLGNRMPRTPRSR